ncbi:unnamed protein product, partial [Brassica oleracea var. botrytis]
MASSDVGFLQSALSHFDALRQQRPCYTQAFFLLGSWTNPTLLFG